MSHVCIVVTAVYYYHARVLIRKLFYFRFMLPPRKCDSFALSNRTVSLGKCWATHVRGPRFVLFLVSPNAPTILSCGPEWCEFFWCLLWTSGKDFLFISCPFNVPLRLPAHVPVVTDQQKIQRAIVSRGSSTVRRWEASREQWVHDRAHMIHIVSIMRDSTTFELSHQPKYCNSQSTHFDSVGEYIFMAILRLPALKGSVDTATDLNSVGPWSDWAPGWHSLGASAGIYPWPQPS